MGNGPPSPALKHQTTSSSPLAISSTQMFLRSLHGELTRHALVVVDGTFLAGLREIKRCTTFSRISVTVVVALKFYVWGSKNGIEQKESK